MTTMIGADWRRLAGEPAHREQALREHAALVFQDVERAERWLRRTNFRIEGNEAPLAACRSPHGFFEAMAELARIDSFERREAQKRAEHRAGPQRQDIAA